MASNQSLIIFTPCANEPPTSNPATLDVRNGRLVLDFNDTTKEYAVFTGVMPYQYGRNGIGVYIHYAMSASSAGNIYWEAEFERIGDGVLDIDTDSFASAKSTNETVPGTIGHVSIVNISFSDGVEIDAIVPGEAFRIRISRDAATDSAVGDAELLAVELREL